MPGTSGLRCRAVRSRPRRALGPIPEWPGDVCSVKWTAGLPAGLRRPAGYLHSQATGQQNSSEQQGEHHHGPLPAGVPPEPDRARPVLAGRGQADRLVHRAHGGAGPLESSLLPVVHRRGAEHVLQRGGPACPRWPGRPAGADLRQPGDRLAAGDDVPGAARRGGAVRRRPDGPRGDRGGAGRHLYADGARGRGGDARVCPDRRGSLGGVRRVRRGRARDADRGRQAGGDRDGVLRHRDEPGGGVQADPGPGDRAVSAQAALVRGAATAAGEGAARRRARPRLGGADGGRAARGLRPGRRDRSALHPVHVGHHREAQGRRPRQRRACRRAALEHAARLRHPARGRVLGRLRHRVGGRALLHRVRAAAGRVHHGSVRGQAGGDAGRGGLLAGHRGPPGQGPVHRPDRVPGDQEGGPGGQVRARPGPVEPALSVPGRGAARPGDLPVGPRTAGHPGH